MSLTEPVAPSHHLAHPFAHLEWPNRFASLGRDFYTALQAQALPDAHWVAVSAPAAELLGLPGGWWQHPPALTALSGGTPWPGMAPLASVYSGHQFGVWAGQLGDGRALLLGELQTPSGPIEVQLKGGGRTPYSRMGDGRAVLRSSIREFLCSEAMHGLGIPTSRALSLTASPLPVARETVETAAIVTRLAPSFVRFGHFEHFVQPGEPAGALQALADHVIDTQVPQCRDQAQPYLALFEHAVQRTAELLADWQAVGFCHGVMNTDNMSILGLTIDYGPFGFLDAFDPNHICNHSDHHGRYAYAKQPSVAFWNLRCLARALLPLIGDADAAMAALESYKEAFASAMQRRYQAKLGLRNWRDPEDVRLVDDLLRLMAVNRVDHTIAWRRLSGFSSLEGARNNAMRDLFMDREGFDAWAERYAARLRHETSIDTERAAAMNRVNPKYVLRNHLAEIAIERARQGNYSEVQKLLTLLERPFDEQPDHEAYADFPPDWAQSLEVSCSS
jgi:uncharacterized protein YdiU (UPF0061 family)